MCQKAFGSFFAPLAGVPLDKFELTRGELAVFRSSEPTERGFCRDCGTPLTFRYLDKPRISVSLGSLDEPEKIPPQRQYGVEGRLSWFGTLVGASRRDDHRGGRARISPAGSRPPTTSTPTTTRPRGRREGSASA